MVRARLRFFRLSLECLFGLLGALLGLLLKRMYDPNWVSDLQSVDDPKSFAPKGECDFHHAGAEAVHWFRESAFPHSGGDGKRIKNHRLRVRGKRLDIPKSRPNPRVIGTDFDPLG